MKATVNSHKRGFLSCIIIFVLAGLLLGRLAYLQLVKGDEYSAKAESQQLGDKEIKASRGTIYDTNMNVLAQSASVWRVYLNPSKINSFKAEKREEVRDIIASGLSVILDMDEAKIRSYTEKNYSYQLVKGEIEKDTRDAIYAFIDQYENREENPIDLSEIVCIDPDVKRYYPYSNLASTVIGFTGSDGDGLEGIEYYYNDVLKGVSGRTLTAIKGNGALMPNQFETIYEAQEGTSIVLTLDIYIQHILEDVLSQALEDTRAQSIYGIAMDVDTGAILGMVSLPDYDLNEPFKLSNDQLIQAYEEASAAPEEESEDADAAYLRSKSYFQGIQWSNDTIVNTYEPGSVFKIITAAAAIEEGVADVNTTHYCSGSIDYATRRINCWKAGGHGSEVFADLLKNSCNPFAVTLADKLGTEKYYDYFEAFGFTEKTGIDSSGDLTPTENILYMSRDRFSKSDLASYSFGQTFQVSPLQMITAVSAVANGGKLMTPYLVSKELDAEGNTIRETSPQVRRQVISESTAKIICDCMEQVVSTGTGKNAYVAGYHIAGKTGTSEKLVVNNKNENTEAYIASFCGFAPAYDPEVAVIIIVDEPVGEHGGGAVAAPLAGDVLEQILTYMGVDHSYTTEEMKLLVETAPNFAGKSIQEARSLVNGTNLSVKVVGDGDTVVGQYPAAGRELPSDGMVVLYTDTDYKSETVTVPAFTGLTVSEANRLAINSGLNIKISGSSLNSGTVFAYKQSVAAGTSVNMGEIITVSFKTTVGVAD